MLDERYSLQTADATLDATEDLLNRLVPSAEEAPTVSVAQVKAASLLIGQAVKLHGHLKRHRPSENEPTRAADSAISSGPFALLQGGSE